MPDPSPHPRLRVLSGMRPTGKLHLGNYVGALQNWVKLQDTHESFCMVADWHALTTDYDDTSRVAGNTVEVVLDFLAGGLDPAKCTIFVQSHVLEHAELHVLLSMITPLGWLERVPSYKDQQLQMPNKDLHMYGFLGYPVLQAADIMLYRANLVPVGEDQVSHLELSREVARRFNQFYRFEGKPVFPEPEALLTRSPKLLGTDKRKMSKSYGNTILLSEEAAKVEEKIKNCVTDRPALSDRGSPDHCPVGNLHQIFSDPERLAYITKGCTTASITCVECKALAVPSVNTHLDPIRERRRQFAEHPERLQEIIQNGAQKAAAAAEETMWIAREAVGLLTIAGTAKAVEQTGAQRMRVPESASLATDDQNRRDILIDAWVEKVSKIHPLRKDRPRTFITRKGRKVGVHTARVDDNGLWEFSFPDRPLNVLVLLAEEGGYLRDYVLPPKFIQAHWEHFEPNGPTKTRKVHMRHEGANPVILVGTRNVPVERYEGQKHEENYSALE
jgi:tryptophanyl-tRNA synthetase